jgi:hypothetical protein
MEIVNALFDGIMAAFNGTAPDDNDDFSNCQAYAHAALASLEASGFKVLRDA